MNISLMPSTPTIYLAVPIVLWSLWLLHRQWRQGPLSRLPGPAAQSWFSGNLGQLFNPKGLPFHLALPKAYGGIVKIYGFFGDIQLYVSDPNSLQSILTKDQGSFEETSVFTVTNKLIFGPGLVATTGEQHKRQRRAVIPIFTIPRLRKVTPIFNEIAEKLANVLEHQVTNAAGDAKYGSSSVLDMSDWMSRVALESVGRTILGYSFDPLDSPHNNHYTNAIKELIPTLFRLALIRQLLPFLAQLGPAWFRRKLVEWTPSNAVQSVMRMSDVMHNAAAEILESKRTALRREKADAIEDHGDRNIISALLKANDQAKESGGEELSDDELTGQMTVLIFGAQDTTSSCLSRILHLLAQHPDIQEKARSELKIAMADTNNVNPEDGRLSFDALWNLPWLDAVLKETLRLYPPVPFVRRSAIKETFLPYTNSDGESSSVRVPIGTTLFVSIAGANRLPAIWGPNADEWFPERWMLNQNHTEAVKSETGTWLRLPGIYSGMLSFLGGGRSCVGYKFAQIEMKIILATLLLRFKFSCSSEESKVVWNLSQIISPSVQRENARGEVIESKGLPLLVENLATL